ncbi:MAG: hypothetical protein Q8L27_00240 [archaeon]|nr:hypothetical protein [archaeon]
MSWNLIATGIIGLILGWATLDHQYLGSSICRSGWFDCFNRRNYQIS